MEQLTPMMQQYMETKNEYKDCILFYRLGDFYEMFFDDAICAHKELELTLTGKSCGLKERAPMCGVPFHSAETYINRLVERGYKVAICEQVEDPNVRKAYGTCSSVVGICCNILLFVLKYVMGTLSHSIAIVSDAFNNLSDCASCLITLFGYKLAAKPADKGHPFGHGRMEYLTSLVIAVMIALMGFELLRNSVEKIIRPDAVQFRWLTLAVLVLSIGVKLWMAWFNTKLGKRIQSTVMIATAKDSRSDVAATGATILALLLSLVTTLPVDGIMGTAVSLFILKTAFDIIRDTVGDLLGKPADVETVQKLKELVLAHEKIIGVHDLILHNYGPGRTMGSCHVEVRSDSDFVAVHEVVDLIEREIEEKLHILMTIHMDPVEVDNAAVNHYRHMAEQVIAELHQNLSLHDFRLVSGENTNRLIFDILVPFDCTYTNDELLDMISGELSRMDKTCQVSLTFDRDFT